MSEPGRDAMPIRMRSTHNFADLCRHAVVLERVCSATGAHTYPYTYTNSHTENDSPNIHNHTLWHVSSTQRYPWHRYL